MFIFGVSFIFFIWFSAFAVFLFSAAGNAEIIKLKGGKEIEAGIVTRTPDYIIVDLRGVSIKYYNDDIVSIETAQKARGKTAPRAVSIDAEGLLREAEDFIYQQRYWEAIGRLKEIVKHDSKNVRACYNMGSAYFMLREYADAVSWYKETIKIDPGHINAHLGIGMAYRLAARFREAAGYLKKACALSPDNALAFSELGACYQSLGDYNMAIESYREVLRVVPDDARAYYALGIAYERTQQLPQAIDAFTNAVKNDPYYADAYFLLASTLASQEIIEAKADKTPYDFSRVREYIAHARKLYEASGRKERLEKIDFFIDRLRSWQEGE